MDGGPGLWQRQQICLTGWVMVGGIYSMHSTSAFEVWALQGKRAGEAWCSMEGGVAMKKLLGVPRPSCQRGEEGE